LDLRPTLELAARNLLECLCPESNFRPYWQISVDENFLAEYQFSRHRDAHNVGRLWNAWLRLEDAIEFRNPPEVEEAMLENTWRMCDNATGTLLADVDPDDASAWYIHSYRETMLSFGLLVRHRAGDVARKARRAGLRAISRMKRACEDPRQWDFSFGSGNANLKMDPRARGSDPVYTHGRAIEGIMCFAEATGEEAAFAEAARLSEFHFRNTVNANGSLAAGCGHHTHSYLNTIRGMLMYADRSADRDRIDVIHATYRDAIAKMITPSAFITHDVNVRYGGDPASAGDVAHIALLLFDHVKDAALLDDVERIIRVRLVPAQVTSPPDIRPRKTEARDCFRDLPNRFVGSIGVEHVNRQICAPDFTASVLHSLTEFYNRIVDRDEEGARVNFHLDYDAPDIKVRSVRDANTARVTVEEGSGTDLFIRIPGWAPESSLKILVDGKPAQIDIRNHFAFLPGRQPRARVRLEYALPQHETRETWRDREATQAEVTFKWRGDEIYEVDPVGEYFKLHPRLVRRLS